MTTRKTNYVGQIQRPGGKTENIELIVNQRQNITELEGNNGITAVDSNYDPGDVLRYFAQLDGTTDDTAAFQRAVDSGHPAFVDQPGTANIEGTIVLDGDKQLSLCAGFNLERQSGSSTAPMLHIYGQNNTFKGNGANIRQDLYAHTKGIVLVGPDPAETAGGTTDVDCYRNRLYDFKVIGPKQTIAQDGSPGIYVHSLKRKAGSYTKSNYYSEFYSIHVVNCDIGMEFSSDANAHSVHGCYINQWQQAAIMMNAAYGNTFYGLKMEVPLSISGTGTTHRYAIHLLAQNGSTIETGTDSGYGIDAAANNNFQGYAELPAISDRTVALFTFTETGTVFGHNKFDIVGQLVGGVGIDGYTIPSSIGTNAFYTSNQDNNSANLVRLHGFAFNPLDDDSGNSFGTDEFKIYSGRMANLSEVTAYDVITFDNVGPDDAALMIKLWFAGKEDAGADVHAGEVSWLCPVTGATANAATIISTAETSESEEFVTWSVAESAGTDTDTGKYILKLTTGSVVGTGTFYYSWMVMAMSSNLEGTNLDWDNDVTIQNGT